MADYVHIENLIMGEVIRIKERRRPDQWQEELEKLMDFLGQMRQQVLMEKLRAQQAVEADPPPPDESQEENPAGDEFVTSGSPAPPEVDSSP